MSDPQVSEEVIKILGTILKEEVSLEDFRAEIEGWDSLKHIDIIFALEDKFSVQFNMEEMGETESVSGLISIVSQKLQSIE